MIAKSEDGKLATTRITNAIIDALRSDPVDQKTEQHGRADETYVVQLDAPVSGQRGRYTGKIVRDSAVSNATGNLVFANIGTAPPQPDCEVWFSGSIPEKLFVGTLVGHKAGGTPIVLIGRPGFDWRYNESRHVFQIANVPDPDPSEDASNTDWTDRGGTQPCSTAARPASSGFGTGARLFRSNGGRGPAFDGGTDVILGANRTNIVRVTTAVSDEDGTDATAILTADGPSGRGAQVFRITAAAIGPTDETEILIFLDTGSAPRFIGRIPVPRTTGEVIVAGVNKPGDPEKTLFEGVWIPKDPENGMGIPVGAVISAGCVVAGSGGSNTFDVTVEAYNID